MGENLLRRDFLKTIPAGAALVLDATAQPGLGAGAEVGESRAKIFVQPFDYEGVRLLPSRWQEQVTEAREFYLAVPSDDILKGFRAAASLPAPGTTLGGWCERNSSTVFGQWLSGMARLSRATGDSELHDKAKFLLAEWSKTVKPDGDCGMRQYPWEKLCCGLVDMHLYANDPAALPMLEKVTDWASRTFDRRNLPASGALHAPASGVVLEWYTLSENLYRAYQVSGNPKFKEFAEVWLYHSFWNKFADTDTPQDAHGVHAYSHVNTFASAAMHYEITGDPATLRILKNAYDYLQHTQCFATGGFGPDERLITPDGSLGKSLEFRQNTFEAVCGSWAGFKISRYLTRFTGEARYGDWMERLFYNGVGAALHITGRGRNFYYADYRSNGGMKVYRYDNFTCCSGSYLQCMADFHNLIYYKDAAGLYVNLYVPSTVEWTHQDSKARIRQETNYPIDEVSTLTIETPGAVEFSLRFRVPEWSRGFAVQINGEPAAGLTAAPGTWAVLTRKWNSGDRVEVRIPLRFRWQPVDVQHPRRAAIVRGPVVMAHEFRFVDPQFRVPDNDDDLNTWLKPDTGKGTINTTPGGPGVFRGAGADGHLLSANLRPYFGFSENDPYFMYVDFDSWPQRL